MPIAQLRTPLVDCNYLSNFSRSSLWFGYNVRQLLVRSLYELGSVSSTTSTQQGFHDLGFGRERPPREGSEKAAVRISPTWSLSRDASLTFGFLVTCFFNNGDWFFRNLIIHHAKGIIQFFVGILSLQDLLSLKFSEFFIMLPRELEAAKPIWMSHQSTQRP